MHIQESESETFHVDDIYLCPSIKCKKHATQYRQSYKTQILHRKWSCMWPSITILEICLIKELGVDLPSLVRNCEINQLMPEGPIT